ncbi:MAG TPA: Rep family protein, partial [Fervidobacterium sp.]|nr:Rep family protein [Fervidobacterium sp.]
MSENVKNMKVKACEVMQYWDYMDCKDIDVIISRIKRLTNLKSYAIITHDKDILPNGELKPAHFHCVLTFSNATTIKSIADTIGVEMQYVEKIRATTKSARLYLIHRNDPDKYQYSPDEVRASFDYVSYVDDCPVKQKRESIAERIESGEIKQYNLCQYVTIDEYSRNYRYYQRCFEYRQ